MRLCPGWREGKARGTPAIMAWHSSSSPHIFVSFKLLQCELNFCSHICWLWFSFYFTCMYVLLMTHSYRWGKCSSNWQLNPELPGSLRSSSSTSSCSGPSMGCTYSQHGQYHECTLRHTYHTYSMWFKCTASDRAHRIGPLSCLSISFDIIGPYFSLLQTVISAFCSFPWSLLCRDYSEKTYFSLTLFMVQNMYIETIIESFT